MNPRPFFSVVIPTKNRADRLRQAVRSVLEQTFGHFEIVVCDNSDEAEAQASMAVVREINDARLSYVRTNGRLSMPDRGLKDPRPK